MHESGATTSPESGWGRRHVVVVLMTLAIVIGYSDRVNISVAAVAMREELGWSQTTKGLVLSSFFIGYMAFMFASGWLATRFGGRRVLGIAGAWWSLFTLLTPLAAATSVPTLIACRIAMGLGEAAMFPACVELVGRWAPIRERTRALAAVHSGISIGTVVGLLATGWIVGRYAWPVAFYAFGAIGLVWTVAWFAMVAEDPANDRRVRQEERDLIARERLTPTQRRAPIPWRALLTHRAFVALVVTHFAVTWTLYVLLTWLPSYFRDAQHVGIATSGLISAAPWLAMAIATFLGAALSDRIVRVSGRTYLARKSMQSIGLLGSGALLLLAPQADTVVAAFAIMCTATGLLGFCWSGYVPNFLDLAPRHSALLLGFSNTIATIPGIVGVAVTGWLVDATGGYGAGFALAASVSVIGALAFIVFGTSTPIEADDGAGTESAQAARSAAAKASAT